MEIFGREYGFLLCVGAEQEIAALCPGGDITRMKEVLVGEKAIGFARDMIVILSTWHEKAKVFNEPGYEPKPLTGDMIDLLPLADFRELQMEALAAFTRDRQQTVEVGETKKNGAVR